MLEILLFEIDRIYSGTQPYLQSLYKAVLCLGYYGLLRIGEMAIGSHSILSKNIHIDINKDKILIILYSSKTHDKSSRPQKVKISAISCDKVKSPKRRHFCPFSVTREYLRQRGNYISDDEQFFVFADHRLIQPDHIRTVLRKLIGSVGLQSHLYDCHSLRIGRASDLYKFGCRLEVIRVMGRWKSNVVYQYLRQ